jgi:hypothetical protein
LQQPGIVSSERRRRNSSLVDETIFGFGRRTPETRHGYQATNKTRALQASQDRTGDSQMRTMSIILAFAFVLAGSSMAGSPDSGLPGVGTFSYNGSPVAAPQVMVVAAR